MIAPYMINFILLVCFSLGLPILFFIIFNKKIMSFFQPQNWVIIEMLERDNNVVSWLQKKEKNLQFIFNNGIYNMFEIKDTQEDTTENADVNKTMPPPIRFIKVFTTIYRQGRLSKLYYKEGSQNPMDFRTGEIKADAQQSLQIEKAQISDILNTGGNLAEDILAKWGLWILLGILLLVLFLVFKK